MAQRLSRFATEFSYNALPSDVVRSVKSRVLDILGLCAAAATLDTSRAAIDFAVEQGGNSQAHVIGMDEKIPAALAAFVNGVTAHSLDYDDTHLPSVLHPSASVIPAALAAAELVAANGEDTIAAIACGLEVCVRLGMAGYDPVGRSSVFFENGQHATSICGAMGAAVSVGLLMGFDSKQIVDALGVTASMASGIIESNRTGGTVKRMHCGWAAHSAVSACQLVRHGFTGPPTSLEGRFGFFQAWLHGQVNYDAVLDQLGEVWEVPKIFFKPYPANHFTHTVIDAASALRAKGLDLGEIESITVGVAAPIVRTIGEPLQVKRRPETGYMAQFSGPYAVVIGLLGGGGLGASFADYDDNLVTDEDRRYLMSKVFVESDDECSKIFPHQFPTVLRITLKNGTELSEKALFNRGGPDRPLTQAELALKFAENASRLIDQDRVQKVVTIVESLESVGDVGEILGVFAT